MVQNIPLIDTHQHLWDLTRLSLPWVNDLELMNRSYLMSDYLEACANSGIEASIYMEVDVDTILRDREINDVTKHCLSPNGFMKGMIISGSPDSVDFDDYLQRNSTNKFIKGVRCVMHVAETPTGYCLTPEFISGVRLLGKRELVFSVCMRPSELGDAISLAEQCPETTFVLDHCGNADPYIVNGQSDLFDDSSDGVYYHSRQGWIDSISKLGSQPNVICKISGIIARARDGWTPETLAPTIDACLDAFGAEKVVFGGDWPVCRFGAELQDWVTAYRAVLSKRDLDFQHKAMHNTAERIYGITL